MTLVAAVFIAGAFFGASIVVLAHFVAEWWDRRRLRQFAQREYRRADEERSRQLAAVVDLSSARRWS